MTIRKILALGLTLCAAGLSQACDDRAAPAAQPAAKPAAAAQPAAAQPAAAQPAAAQPAAAQPIAQPATAQPPAVEPAAKPAGEPEDNGSCLGPDGKQHKFPLDVYDENADGFKTIQDAIARAKQENKRVLVMWGENWCQFCLFLVDVLQNDPGVSPIVKSDYVWVRVDFGRGFSKGLLKHKELADSYGVKQLETRPDGKTMGAPALCIIDPVTGQTVGKNDPARNNLEGVLGGNDMIAKPLTLQRMFDEALIKQWLITWRPPAKPALGAMNEAKMVAKRDNRTILALFTMPNDEACEKLAAWVSRPDASAALTNSFAIARIDVERMSGGQAMMAEAAGKPMLPPLMCVVDESGKGVGGAPAQITGLPRTEAEIESFMKALSAAAKIGDADRATLVKSLKDTQKLTDSKNP